MRKRIAGRTLSRVVSLLAFMALGTGSMAFAPVASAAEPTKVLGPTVTADPSSPTGETVTFVYLNPNATQVQLAGDLTLLDVNTGPNVRYQPEEWQPGRYHAGGVEFRRDMTKDADGYWSVSIPMTAGGLSYWYRVWDPTQSWTDHRIWDPAGTQPRPAVDPNNVFNSTPFREKNNNDVLGVAYVPYADKMNDPTLKSRATYELPIADPSKRGTVQYIPYTTILGGAGFHLGIYLPAGYDPNRAQPYKVLYLAHGIFGDETDFMIPVNVPNILDNMIARGEIEPTVVVTMGNHFTGTSLGFASYNQTNAANNLVQTILPLVEATYNVSTQASGRGYGGFSYGGMTGGIVIKTFPTTFGFYGFFSGNPSLTAANYDSIAAAAGNNLSVFLGNGFFEGGLSNLNTIANNFKSRGIPAGTAQVPGAHDGMTAGQLFTIFARDYLWSGVDSVSVTPATANVMKGWVKQFTPHVITNPGVSPAVTWSVEGAASAGTTISADGLLSVAADETASSLTVVATSVVDQTKVGSATVTLVTPGTTPVVVQAKTTPASIVGGGTFRLNVAVRAEAQHKTAQTVTGEIAVTFGGTTQIVPLTSGAAVVTLPTASLSAGVYTVHVAYSGDTTYAPYAAGFQDLRVR